jgi:phage shock protein A
LVVEGDCGFDCAGWDDSKLEISGANIHALRVYTAGMSSGVSVDEFQALEQKVLRAVEIVKREREARASAEAEVAALREQLATRAADAEGQVAALQQERDAVRQRVEKMLAQMDELV